MPRRCLRVWTDLEDERYCEGCHLIRGTMGPGAICQAYRSADGLKVALVTDAKGNILRCPQCLSAESKALSVAGNRSTSMERVGMERVG